MKKRIIIPLISLIILMCANSFAETSATLTFYKRKLFPIPSKEKRTLNIFLSDSTGTKNFSLQRIASSDTIYLTFTSAEKWELKKYYKKFKQKLFIKQENKEIPPIRMIEIKKGKKTEKLIATFQRHDLSVKEPFKLCFKKECSGELKIPPLPLTFEQEYMAYYVEGQDSYQSGNYLQSYEKLQMFLSDETKIKNLPFFFDATELLRNSITKYITSENEKYNLLQQEFAKNSDESFKQDFEIFKNEIEITRQTFSPYFQFYDDKNDSIMVQNLNALISKSDNQIRNIDNMIRNRKLSIFRKSYYDNNEFSIYIETLTRMLCFTDTISMIDTLSLNISLLEKLPEIENNLKELQLYNKFAEIILLLSDNIKQNHYVLGKSAMDNLFGQIDSEKQPYYKILCAFNSLCNNNRNLFSKYITEAYWKCTDENLLKNLEFQNLSIRATSLGISESALHVLNQSLRYFMSKDNTQAFAGFQKAKSLSNNFCLPLYYLGIIEFGKGNVFVGIAAMNEAIEKYPEFIAPRKFLIDHYMETHQYSKALFVANSAINKLPIWHFYFSKANILAAMGKYPEAIDICEICLQINPYDFYEYLFLGDQSLEIDDRHAAKAYYSKAAEILPDNPQYEKRMKAFKD